MMRHNLLLMFFACLSINLGGCGPTSNGGNGGGGDGSDAGGGAPDGPPGTLSGRVWAPGNAPGMVPAGHEIPIAGALVSLSRARAIAIPQQAYCEPCVEAPTNSTLTDAAGNFTLTVPSNSYWLTIQKGQFRLEQQVVITADETLTLTPEAGTMPSIHDPANGKWIPRIALVPGTWDRLEDVVGKMGIGEVSDKGAFQGDKAPATQLDLYRGDGGPSVSLGFPPKFDPPYQYKGSITELFSDINILSQYHIVFIPCGGDTDYTGDADQYNLLNDPAVRDRITEFVRRGGKLYVTDWSSEWEDGVFPEFVKFDSVDTTKGGRISHGNGTNDYTSNSAKVIDPELNVWLGMQSGPKADQTVGPYDANDLEIHGNWNRIVDTPEVVVGQDDQGADIVETAHTWVVGDWNNDGAAAHPLTVTFEPVGCGRIMYSTYHTTEGAHPGLAPQERILLYLIMEIGECKAGPIID